MKRVFLDTGVLGLASQPSGSQDALDCKKWVLDLLAAGHAVHVPEISDYELRRELIRAKKANGLNRLNELHGLLTYSAITTTEMMRAAELWAKARNEGHPTASDPALDGDVILAAQVQLHIEAGEEAIVATTNVAHLSLFVPASKWSDIAA